MKRGRPPIAAQSVRVSVRIPVETYDRLDRLARRSDKSVPDVIRTRLNFGADKSVAAEDAAH